MAHPWRYIPDVLRSPLSETLWNELIPLTEKFYTKDSKAPVCNPQFVYCSDPPGHSYKYFNIPVLGQAFPASLIELGKFAEHYIVEEYKKTCHFNAAFINWYPSNEVHIPWHRDKTHKDFFIASFTLQEDPSESRSFSIRMDQTQQIWTFPLEHQSLLIMEPGMQEAYEHSVPPTIKKQKGRLNITLRIETPRKH